MRDDALYTPTWRRLDEIEISETHTKKHVWLSHYLLSSALAWSSASRPSPSARWMLRV